MPTNSASPADAALRRAGLKVTRPRRALLGFLIEEHGPFTLEEIHRRLHSQCDLVTVYRSLSAFETSHLVRRCDFGDGTARFEYQPEDQHHHHVICRQCRRVRSLDRCFVDEIEKRLGEQGYTDIKHSLEFFAVCATCRSEPKRAKTKKPC